MRFWPLAVLMAMSTLYVGLVPALTDGAAATAPSTTLHGNGSVDEAWLTGAAPGDHLTLMQDGTGGRCPATPAPPIARFADHPEPHAGDGVLVGRRDDGPARRPRSPSWRRARPGDELGPLHQPADARGAQLHHHAGRDQAGRHRALPLRRDVFGHQPLPHRHRVLGLQHGRPHRPRPRCIAQALRTACTECGNPKLLPDTATDGRVGDRPGVRLRHRQPPDARDRLLGRRLRPLRVPSDYDAYDAIEIIAHQSWVAHHTIGMVGISYSGLSQFPAAGTDPPGLAAIAPDEPDRRSLLDRVSRAASTTTASRPVGSSRASTTPSRPPSTATVAWSEASRPRSRTSASPGPTRRSTRNWPRATGGSSTCLANQALHEPVREPGQPGRAQAGGSGDRGRAVRRRCSTAVRWSTGRPTSRSRSSSPGHSRTSRPGRSGPHSSTPSRRRRRCSPTWSTAGTSTRPIPRRISRWLEFLDIYVADKVPTQPNSLAAIILDKFAVDRLVGHAPGAAARDSASP